MTFSGFQRSGVKSVFQFTVAGSPPLQSVYKRLWIPGLCTCLLLVGWVRPAVGDRDEQIDGPSKHQVQDSDATDARATFDDTRHITHSIRRWQRRHTADTAAEPARAFAEMVFAAQQAASRGDHDAAQQWYRKALQQRPDDKASWAALQNLVRGRSLQADTSQLELARNSLSDQFRTYETTRFIVLSDAERNWSRQQAERLERAWQEFTAFANQLDLRPHPLQHKLLCILFNDREMYHAFALAQDKVDQPWIAGYYSPRNRWIVFYHIDSNPDVAEARKQLATMREYLDDLADRVRSARRSGRHNEARALEARLREHQTHLRAEASRLDVFASNVSVATTVHEAVHQLSFETNVQSPNVDYPLWISEGIATAFETGSANQRFGPGDEYQPRQDTFRSLYEDKQLLPLRELLIIRRVCDEEDVAVIYAQSYALFRWLFQKRPDQLSDYLNLMRRQQHTQLDDADQLRLFEQAFGSVEALERQWLAFERNRTLRSPAR